MQSSIRTESYGQIRVITLNEPKKMNALSFELKHELLTELQSLQFNQDIKVIILTGSGKAFCAGGDVKAMQESYDAESIRRNMELSKHIIMLIRNCEKLVISMVNGVAAGAGMSLALATDLSIAEKNAKFILAFKNLGLIPDLGLHYYLPNIIGEKKAKKWFCDGASLTAMEALGEGLINEVVEEGTGMEYAIEMAQQLLEGPVDSFILSKSLINQQSNDQIEKIMTLENMHQTLLRGNEDHLKRLQTFFAQRN